MEAEKIIKAARLYEEYFRCAGYNGIPLDQSDKSKTFEEIGIVAISDHCCWMATEIPGFVKEDRLEKAQRWLCFIQGVLFCNNFFSINDFKNHNKPEE